MPSVTDSEEATGLSTTPSQSPETTPSPAQPHVEASFKKSIQRERREQADRLWSRLDELSPAQPSTVGDSSARKAFKSSTRGRRAAAFTSGRTQLQVLLDTISKVKEQTAKEVKHRAENINGIDLRLTCAVNPNIAGLSVDLASFGIVHASPALVDRFSWFVNDGVEG